MGLFSQRAAGWRRFLAPYYAYSAVLIASYWLTRSWFLSHGGHAKYTHVYHTGALFQKERFAVTLLAMALAIKYWRRQSLDSFLSDALTYSKSLVVLMVWYMDWRISVYYVLLFLVMYLVFPQPIFQGASAVEQFTPASFQSMVAENPQPGLTWLVEFYAPWAPPCIHLEPVFAELSLKFTTPQLRFGKVDVSRWPQLAKQHKVAVYGTLPQLPTFISFKGGKEEGRIPHVFPDGSVATIKIRREDIVTAFALDEFLEEAKKAEGKKKAAAPARGAGGGSAKKKH
ncbi:hypothetical protein CHLNCDRAFT_59562 [Chlorella variabilis]|uniref:Thioredoxin domain-containing protein n=1 Tax=Chlorella variabilis TaxID=554065 RepID=E1Z3Q8_CHLVA|nr:hypothetical protein CHLNCDRAFT_59562 [Chlorella variabilis]EFN59218.1 hypothetical protein CHLNCDRAFT_59562 [Chlorella variabilis]|eukprot:XP_005851320.1 hypothetical protein CHLNCDRAFT_59562 [Chlorella variabilis]